MHDTDDKTSAFHQHLRYEYDPVEPCLSCFYTFIRLSGLVSTRHLLEFQMLAWLNVFTKYP